jgi:hypothetical protein
MKKGTTQFRCGHLYPQSLRHLIRLEHNRKILTPQTAAIGGVFHKPSDREIFYNLNIEKCELKQAITASATLKNSTTTEPALSL